MPSDPERARISDGMPSPKGFVLWHAPIDRILDGDWSRPVGALAALPSVSTRTVKRVLPRRRQSILSTSSVVDGQLVTAGGMDVAWRLDAAASAQVRGDVAPLPRHLTTGREEGPPRRVRASLRHEAPPGGARPARLRASEADWPAHAWAPGATAGRAPVRPTIPRCSRAERGPCPGGSTTTTSSSATSR
jgi:hypothetical protein